MNWTSRERVIAAIEHREPDRVPIDITPQLDFYLNLKAYLGADFQEDLKPSFHMEVIPHPRILAELGADISSVKLSSPKAKKAEARTDGLVADMWGVVYRKVENTSGYYMEAVEHPLADFKESDLDKYPFPRAENVADGEATEAVARRLYEDTELGLIGRFGGPIVEIAFNMVGFEKWLILCATQPDLAGALLTKITDIQIGLDRIGLEATGKYIQIFRASGDDFGTQRGPLYSPAMFRRLFLPHFVRRWNAARDYLAGVNPSVKLMLHSCGSIRKLIPDLIGAGIQVLDPIQPLATGMDSFELKQEYGSQLTFHGGVDIQEVLPFGSVEDVEEEVKLRMRALAPGGGYLLSTSHFIQSDTPPANIAAMCRAVHKFGQYPIQS